MKHPRLSAIVAASLLMASTVGFAAHQAQPEPNFKGEVAPPCPPVMMLHDGFYVGAGVGYDSYRLHSSTDQSLTVLIDPPLSLETADTSVDLSGTGWMGGVFAGYGHYFDWMYLGVELNANTSAAKSTLSANDAFLNTPDGSFDLKLRARTSYGIGILPGIKLNDSTLLYIRLAYLRANFKANLDITDFNTNNTFSFSDSEWRNAFQYGIGLETYIAENVSVRGEFDHSRFNTKSFGDSFVFDDVIRFSSDTSFKPSNNEFMFSLLYHFC